MLHHEKQGDDWVALDSFRCQGIDFLQGESTLTCQSSENFTILIIG
jgi:hypothetical protein